MVMTRPVDGDAATDVGAEAPRRVVARTPGVPGGRAVLGGLLVALAGLGTFLSWQRASGTPDRSYAVAERTLRPGDPITADAVRFEPIDLPDDVAGAAFRTPAELEGRVLVAPVGEGELLQSGALSDQGQGPPAAEVSLALTRDLAVDGRLQSGDAVDVYATHDDGTSLVAEGVRVISVTEAGGSFGDGRELTVTLALTDPARRVPVIHAARAGQITLVRTTHVPRAAGPAGPADPGGTAPSASTAGAADPGGTAPRSGG
jgi:Flp pilus assembly protein CpaB